MPITEEVRECTSQWTISTYVTGYYSKFDKKVNAFVLSVDWLMTKKVHVVCLMALHFGSK